MNSDRHVSKIGSDFVGAFFLRCRDHVIAFIGYPETCKNVIVA